MNLYNCQMLHKIGLYLTSKKNNDFSFQAPISEYQESVLEWYLPYGVTDLGDGEGLGEEDIFQP